MSFEIAADDIVIGMLLENRSDTLIFHPFGNPVGIPIPTATLRRYPTNNGFHEPPQTNAYT